MFKTLISCCICIMMFTGGNMDKISIDKQLTNASQVQVIVDNSYYKIEDVNEINKLLNQMLNNSINMPAFGVSIHTETLKAIKAGVWLKFSYETQQSVDGMTFDELLIEIKPEFQGFNIIRGNKGIYEGRCFYINLVDKDMKDLYNFINLTYSNDKSS